ncbi:MAG: hypothetical protein U5L45_00415 [Saprospiraceae bacterium]|nr:hypothetical protein [Saprospiraceae bacterium]
MTIQEANEIIINAIQKGVDIERQELMFEIKSFVEMVTQGKGELEYLKKLRPSEDARQKEQRARVYHSPLRYASKKITDILYRLKHVENVKIEYRGANKAVIDRVSANLANFYDEKPLLSYLIDLYVENQKSDPNELILFTPETIRAANGAAINVELRPTRISSEEIHEIHETDDGIKWIIARKLRTISVARDAARKNWQNESVCDYYLYGEGITQIFIRSTEGDDNAVDVTPPPSTLLPTKYPVQRIEIERSDEVHKYLVYSYDAAPECPVIRVSGRRDATNKSACTSLLMESKDAFKELIARKSEFDLTVQLHVFPKMAMLVSKCANVQDGEECSGGKCGSKTCNSCGGTGKNHHVGSQDIIEVVVDPNTPPNEILDIKNLVHYFQHDEFAPTFLADELTKILSRISDGIFETNIFGVTTNIKDTQGGQFQTATATNVNWQKMYMSLYGDAEHIAKMYQYVARFQSLALNGNKPSDFVATVTFPRDFKFKTLKDLLIDYEQAQKIGLPFDVLKTNLAEIILKQSPDNPIIAAWGIVKIEMRPFQGISADMLKTILAGRGTNDFQRVLYENFDEIFDEVASEMPEFVGMDYKLRIEKLRTKVAEFAARIDYTTANDLNTIFNI